MTDGFSLREQYRRWPFHRTRHCLRPYPRRLSLRVRFGGDAAVGNTRHDRVGLGSMPLIVDAGRGFNLAAERYIWSANAIDKIRKPFPGIAL
eukprot:3876610-Pyramimonas_sp.AAC.1